MFKNKKLFFNLVEIKYWRVLLLKGRAILKEKHGVKVVTFDFICMCYENNKSIIW